MTDNFTKLFIDILKQPTQEKKREQFQIIINQIEKVKTKIDQTNTLLDLYNTTIDRLKGQGLSKQSAQHYAVNILHLNISLKREEQQLQKVALEGYEIIQKVREKLTKQHILYQIGVGSKKREILLETKMSYAELVPLLYLEKRTDGYTIRIKASQKQMKQLNKARQQQMQVSVDQINIFTPGASSLYSSVYRYYKNERLNQKIGNWGNFYETYRRLLFMSPHGNKWVPDANTIANAFKETLSNVGSQGSFSVGGDVGLESDKFAAGNRPTLTSINTIINQLDLLIQGLQDYLNNNNEEGLIKMFVGVDSETKVLKGAQMEAIDNLREVLKSFNLTK